MKAWTLVDERTGRFIRQHALIDSICSCGNEFKTSSDRIAEGRGKFCSKACMYKYRSPRPIKESAGYSAIHKWVAKEYGQDMKCEWCGFETDNKYQIHWANLSGDYQRDRDDWARLCAKCHWHFDREGIHG